MADFRKMAVWQKADDLVVLGYQMTAAFPDEERYGLTDQMRRAATSVPANIAEGSGRQTLIDFRQFLYIARGSLNELEYFIHLAERLAYLDGTSVEELTRVRHEVGGALQGMINWATREIDKGRRDL